MSDQSNNIDKFFQDRLKGHSTPAPANAWSRLQHDLNKPAKSLYFWYSRGAAAAVLLLLAFGAGYFFSEYNRSSDGLLVENPVIIENQESLEPLTDLTNAIFIEENGEDFGKNSENQKLEVPAKIIAEVSKEEINFKESPNTETNLKSGIVEKENYTAATLSDVEENLNQPDAREVFDSNTSIADNAATQPDEVEKTLLDAGSTDVTPVSVKDIPVMDAEMLHQLLIGDQEDYTENLFSEPNQNKNSKWVIGGRISPIYSYRNINGDAFNTPDESVSVDVFNSNEEAIVSMAGGISLDYAFSNRFSLASGMYISRIGQQNNDVLAYNDPGSANMYKLATSTGTVTVNPGKFERVIAEQPSSVKDSMPGDYTVSGSFVQNLDYLEVPLVLKYKLLDKKLSLNVLGGLSPGILVNNQSYFSVDGEKLQTGTTENINPFIYNSVLGFGIEYSITGKLSVSMEPSFKYSLSPVNNSNNGLEYRPYSLSWFTGISYKLY